MADLAHGFEARLPVICAVAALAAYLIGDNAISVGLELSVTFEAATAPCPSVSITHVAGAGTSTLLGGAAAQCGLAYPLRSTFSRLA